MNRKAVRVVSWAFFSEILHIFIKEMRSLGRDRHTVIYSVVLPLFLYPSLVWGGLQIILYTRGLEEEILSRILVAGAPPGGGILRHELSKELTILPPAETPGWLPLCGEEAPPERLRGIKDLLARRECDALLVMSPVPSDAAGSPEVTARIYFEGAEDRSRLALRRLEDFLERYREERITAEATELGEGEEFLDAVSWNERSLSTRREYANYLASLILPLVMMIMTALGALYPALDTTVGEKERGTLETTLVSPVRRLSLVLGKYFSVVVFAILAFALNFGSMAFTLGHIQSQFRLEALSLGFGSAAIILMAAVLLALFLSAVMMLLGFLAKTFREGQSYVTPVFVLTALPAIISSSPDMTVTPVLAYVPVVNISLVFRDALQGRFGFLTVAAAMTSSACYTLVALYVATRLLRREEFATGESLSLRDAMASVLGGKS